MFLDNYFFEEKCSSIIKIRGTDKFKFLQGIISNDIEILREKPSIYSSILSPQGKFNYDFFISLHENNILIEINNENVEIFLKKLNLFKLRSDVSFEILENIKIFLTNINFIKKLDEVRDKKVFLDPRFNSLFLRIYLFNDLDHFYKNANRYKFINQKEFLSLRLKNAVPDFFVDAKFDKSLLLEMRFDELNGISWDKGCYLGQEVTARMYYRKITKRKLTHIKVNFKNTIEDSIFLEEKEVGFITSHDKKYGFGYVNTDVLNNENNKLFTSGDSILELKKIWWAS